MQKDHAGEGNVIFRRRSGKKILQININFICLFVLKKCEKIDLVEFKEIKKRLFGRKIDFRDDDNL